MPHTGAGIGAGPQLNDSVSGDSQFISGLIHESDDFGFANDFDSLIPDSAMQNGSHSSLILEPEPTNHLTSQESSQLTSTNGASGRANAMLNLSNTVISPTGHISKHLHSAQSHAKARAAYAAAAAAAGMPPPDTNAIPPKSLLIKTDKPRPYSCLTCTRSFARLEHLKRHERSHTKEKPFGCDVCDRRFARRDLLLRHRQKLHPDAPPPVTGADYHVSPGDEEEVNSSSASAGAFQPTGDGTEFASSATDSKDEGATDDKPESARSDLSQSASKPRRRGSAKIADSTGMQSNPPSDPAQPGLTDTQSSASMQALTGRLSPTSTSGLKQNMSTKPGVKSGQKMGQKPGAKPAPKSSVKLGPKSGSNTVSPPASVQTMKGRPVVRPPTAITSARRRASRSGQSDAAHDSFISRAGHARANPSGGRPGPYHIPAAGRTPYNSSSQTTTGGSGIQNSSMSQGYPDQELNSVYFGPSSAPTSHLEILYARQATQHLQGFYPPPGGPSSGSTMMTGGQYIPNNELPGHAFAPMMGPDVRPNSKHGDLTMNPAFDSKGLGHDVSQIGPDDLSLMTPNNPGVDNMGTPDVQDFNQEQPLHNQFPGDNHMTINPEVLRSSAQGGHINYPTGGRAHYLAELRGVGSQSGQQQQQHQHQQQQQQQQQHYRSLHGPPSNPLVVANSPMVSGRKNSSTPYEDSPAFWESPVGAFNTPSSVPVVPSAPNPLPLLDTSLADDLVDDDAHVQTDQADEFVANFMRFDHSRAETPRIPDHLNESIYLKHNYANDYAVDPLDFDPDSQSQIFSYSSEPFNDSEGHIQFEQHHQQMQRPQMDPPANPLLQMQQQQRLLQQHQQHQHQHQHQQQYQQSQQQPQPHHVKQEQQVERTRMSHAGYDPSEMHWASDAPLHQYSQPQAQPQHRLSTHTDKAHDARYQLSGTQTSALPFDDEAAKHVHNMASRPYSSYNDSEPMSGLNAQSHLSTNYENDTETTGSTGSSRMPSSADIRKYVAAYFKEVAPLCAFVHQTSRLSRQNMPLVMAMASLGALCLGNEDTACALRDATVEALDRVIAKFYQPSNSGTLTAAPLWVVQALALVALFCFLMPGREHRELAQRMLSRAQQIAVSQNLMRTTPQLSAEDWKRLPRDELFSKYLQSQHRARICFLIFNLGSCFSSRYLNDLEPDQALLSGISVSDDSMWNATSANQWYETVIENGLQYNAMSDSQHSPAYSALIKGQCPPGRTSAGLLFSAICCITLEATRPQRRALLSPSNDVSAAAIVAERERMRAACRAWRQLWTQAGESASARVLLVNDGLKTLYSEGTQPLSTSSANYINTASQVSPLMVSCLPVATSAELHSELDLSGVLKAAYRRDFTLLRNELNQLRHLSSDALLRACGSALVGLARLAREVAAGIRLPGHSLYALLEVSLVLVSGLDIADQRAQHGCAESKKLLQVAGLVLSVILDHHADAHPFGPVDQDSDETLGVSRRAARACMYTLTENTTWPLARLIRDTLEEL